jgi:tetratricopeptide (TPR) repeat protein
MNRDDPSPASLESIATLLEEEDFEPAARFAGYVIATEPRNAKAWCLMTRAQLGQRRNQAALAAARAAGSISPHSELPHRLASYALIRLGRSHDAVAAARVAVRFAPRDWRTHQALSQSLLADQAYNDARLAAEHAVRLAPDQAEPHVAVGVAARYQHRLRESRSAFERALALDPRQPTARHHLVTLRHRTITPRGLAQAVNAFAQAAADGEDTDGNRQSTEFTIVKFMARFVLLVAYGTVLAASRGAVADPAALVFLVLAVLYAAIFLVVLDCAVRPSVVAIILASRKLKLSWALEAVAIASVLTTHLSGAGGRGAGAAIGGVCACAAAILVQFARLGTLRDLGTPEGGVVYRRNVRWVAIIAGLSTAAGLVALKSHHGNYDLILLAVWVPALGLLLVRARGHARHVR